MTSSPPSIILNADEIKAITGAVAPAVQFNELRRLGFTRVRRGLDRSLILERAHYEAVCSGAIVPPLGNPPNAPAAATVKSVESVSNAPAPTRVRGRPQKITLEEWARLNYGTTISKWVLSKWRREGQIYPPPERVWPHWMVEPDARRNVNGNGYVPLVERIEAGRR